MLSGVRSKLAGMFDIEFNNAKVYEPQSVEKPSPAQFAQTSASLIRKQLLTPLEEEHNMSEDETEFFSEMEMQVGEIILAKSAMDTNNNSNNKTTGNFNEYSEH